MTVAIAITLENDLCLGQNAHMSLGPTCPVPAPTPSLELFCTMKRFPGYELGKNKLAENVTLDDKRVVLDGHDVGLNDCDFTPLCPANALLPLAWLNASRKTLFSAAKVTMTKADVPVAGVDFVMSLPMLTCGDPFTLPLTHRITGWTRKCVVGFEGSDIAAGWLTALSAVVIDAIAFAINGLPARAPTRLREAFGPDAGKFIFGAGDTGSLVKLVLGPLLDGGVSYVRGRMNGTNDWNIKWTVGGPLMNAEYTVGSTGGAPVVERVQLTFGNRQWAHSTADRQWTTTRQPLPWDPLFRSPPTQALNAPSGDAEAP